MRAQRAFTLLEVMVAVAILGLSLTVILSAQGGLSASNRSAQNMGLASSLGRCKMNEIEEKLLRDGYPDLDRNEDGIACCDSGETEPFSCDTKVEKVELPTPPSASADGGLNLASLGAPLGSAGAGGAGGAPGLPGAPGAIGALDLDAGVQGLGSQVASQLGPGGASGMLDMVLSMVYPSLKPVMEASIRRVTVIVRWKEGPNAKELELVQFVTNPQRSPLLAGFPGGDGGVPGLGGPGLPGAPGAAPGLPAAPGLAPRSLTPTGTP